MGFALSWCFYCFYCRFILVDGHGGCWHDVCVRIYGGGGGVESLSVSMILVVVDDLCLCCS